MHRIWVMEKGEESSPQSRSSQNKATRGGRDLNHALTQSVVWSYGFLYLHCKPCRYDHNTQATHGTQRIAAHGTQRMARNARQHKIQSLACSTTITLHPLLAGMMKTCSIVHITSISSHKHLYPLSSLFTYPSPSSFDLLMSSCTTIHHSEWGRVHKHSCLMSCNLCIPLHLICILSPILPSLVVLLTWHLQWHQSNVMNDSWWLWG